MENFPKQAGRSFLIQAGILVVLIIMVVIYFLDIRKSAQEREYDRFMVFLGHYYNIVNDRNECFERIYYAWVDTDDFRAEKLKDLNSVNYLLWRLSDTQHELVAIENELLVLETQCIGYINELCAIAIKNKRALEILRLKESYELYFYTTRFKTFNEFYETQRIPLNLKPLMQNNIEAVFEGELK